MSDDIIKILIANDSSKTRTTMANQLDVNNIISKHQNQKTYDKLLKYKSNASIIGFVILKLSNLDITKACELATF